MKSELRIDTKDKAILLEALEDLMYKTSIHLQQLKGGPVTRVRNELTKKQKRLDTLQHNISTIHVD